MKKISRRQIVGTIGFVIVFLIVFSCLTHIFIPKFSYERLEDYNKIPKNSLDAVYIGTSHIACSISPMTVWGESGIKSYNFSTAAQAPQSTYYISQDIAKRHQPKVVFLELSRILEDYDIEEHLRHLRRSMDQRPLSIEKMKIAWELAQQSGVNRAKKLMEYTFPLAAHHYRWYELDQRDFENFENRMEKGQRQVWAIRDMTDEVPKYEEGLSKYGTAPYEYDERSLDYYCRTIEFWQEQGAEVVLIELPQLKDTADRVNAVSDLAEKYDVKFLNCNSEELFSEINLVPNEDYMNSDHLNPWGATKMSVNLAEYMKDELKLDGYNGLSQEDYDYWKNEYDMYYNHYKGFLLNDFITPVKVEERWVKANE